MNPFRASKNVTKPGLVQPGRSAVISVLDVGSSKITCMIAKLRPRSDSALLPGRSHTIEVLGLGHQRSRGIKSGVVVNMDEAEKAIRLAVDSAERTAGMTVDSLIVSLSAGRLGSQTFRSDIELADRAVRHQDVQAILAKGVAHASQDGRSVVHALPIGYALDGQRKITQPEGMLGEKLRVDMHLISADEAPLGNLELCINRAHLAIDAVVATPYASGISALVEDESRMGAACIDMGGGTTTISIFLDGHFVHGDTIAVGGNHVTMDVARCLSIAVNDAERLKVLSGTVAPTQDAEDELLQAASIDHGNSQTVQFSTAQMSEIICPRIEETFELLRDRIGRSGFAELIGRRVVLTGGASQLAGVSDVAARILGANVRLGRPMGIAGLPKTAKGPSFSTATGLMIYPQICGNEYGGGMMRGGSTAPDGASRLARVGQWLRESF